MDEERIEKERAQFVAALISLLGEAKSQDLLSFTAVRGMNFEEVSICVPYFGFDDYNYIVLCRIDKRNRFRPYAAEHFFRICNSSGEDACWFPPLVLNDSASEDKFLCALRDRLAELHARLMREAPQDHFEVSARIFKQNMFLAMLRHILAPNNIISL